MIKEVIQVRLVFDATSKALAPPGDLTLFVDGQEVGGVKVRDMEKFGRWKCVAVLIRMINIYTKFIASLDAYGDCEPIPVPESLWQRKKCTCLARTLVFSWPCKVEISMRWGFALSETFDVGMDLGGPVSLHYEKLGLFVKHTRGLPFYLLSFGSFGWFYQRKFS